MASSLSVCKTLIAPHFRPVIGGSFRTIAEPGSATNAAPAGFITVVLRSVAAAEGSVKRGLTLDAPVRVGDVVATGQRSAARLELVDGGLLDLGSDSSASVTAANRVALEAGVFRAEGSGQKAVSVNWPGASAQVGVGTLGVQIGEQWATA